MKSALFTIWSVAFLIGLNALPAAEPANPVSLKQRDYQSALKAGIKAYESWLARHVKLQQQGASSEQEVSFGRQTLAMLRYDLAVIDDDDDAAAEHAREFVKCRENDYERIAKLRASGAVPPGIVEVVRRRLADARYLLAVQEQEADEVVAQLETIIELSTSELRRAEAASKTGGASAADIGLQRGRIAFTNYLLESVNGNAAEAIQFLRIVIAERETAMNRMEKLVLNKAASKAHLAETRLSWLRARANLAIEEEQRDAARDVHKRLAETARELSDYLTAHPTVTTPELVALSKATAVDYEFQLMRVADAGIPLRSLLRKPLADLDN